MKICTMCKEKKSEEDFAFRNKKTGRRNSRCRVCQSILMKKHYADNIEKYAERNKTNNSKVYKRNREYLTEYLSSHPCVDCGESDIQVLQFDHVDALLGGKQRPTNSGWISLAALESRIQLCEVRCANCHVRRTRSQFGWNLG